MKKHELVLTTLALAKGNQFTPAQLQKALFLLSQNMPSLLDEGSSFHFVPYDYGPFDKSAYEDAALLRNEGLAEISPAQFGRWNVYRATEKGVAAGLGLLETLPKESSAYIDEVVSWVRSQSFTSLVKSIYEAYPAMRVNSIFRE